MVKDEEIIIHQRKMIENLYRYFQDELKSFKKKNIPMTQGDHVIRPECDKDLDLTFDYFKNYQSGVGLLLYIVRHSRPDLSNCVRELSKSMTLTTRDNYKKLLRVIRYIYDTK